MNIASAGGNLQVTVLNKPASWPLIFVQPAIKAGAIKKHNGIAGRYANGGWRAGNAGRDNLRLWPLAIMHMEARIGENRCITITQIARHC
jgi:hypothetical protein